MSKKRVTKKSVITPTRSTVARVKQNTLEENTPKIESNSADDMLFGKINYLYILGGISLMIIGYLLMSGGHMPDANTWDDEIIYSTRRTLIAPIFILAGLVVQVLAIFKR